MARFYGGGRGRVHLALNVPFLQRHRPGVARGRDKTSLPVRRWALGRDRTTTPAGSPPGGATATSGGLRAAVLLSPARRNAAPVLRRRAMRRPDPRDRVRDPAVVPGRAAGPRCVDGVRGLHRADGVEPCADGRRSTRYVAAQTRTVDASTCAGSDRASAGLGRSCMRADAGLARGTLDGLGCAAGTDRRGSTTVSRRTRRSPQRPLEVLGREANGKRLDRCELAAGRLRPGAADYDRARLAGLRPDHAGAARGSPSASSRRLIRSRRARSMSTPFDGRVSATTRTTSPLSHRLDAEDARSLPDPLLGGSDRPQLLEQLLEDLPE